jgi:hypothetical protein
VLDPSFLWFQGKVLEAWLFCLRLRFSFVFGFGEEEEEEEEELQQQQQGRSVVVVVGVHKVVKLLCQLALSEVVQIRSRAFADWIFWRFGGLELVCLIAF